MGTFPTHRRFEILRFCIKDITLPSSESWDGVSKNKERRSRGKPKEGRFQLHVYYENFNSQNFHRSENTTIEDMFTKQSKRTSPKEISTVSKKFLGFPRNCQNASFYYLRATNLLLSKDKDSGGRSATFWQSQFDKKF